MATSRTQNVITAPCPDCGESVSFEPVFTAGNATIAPYCDACTLKHQEEHDRNVLKLLAERSWSKICPSRYRDTELGKLPRLDCTQKAMDWDFNNGHGINLWGVPATGKTRTMFLILQRAHQKGNSIKVFTPVDFCAELERRAYHRAPWIQQLSRLDILAFDDMDKLSLTAPQEKLFFGLLDKRMTQHRPCLFTHNSTANELQYKFRAGQALVRRIRDFTKSVNFV